VGNDFPLGIDYKKTQCKNLTYFSQQVKFFIGSLAAHWPRQNGWLLLQQDCHKNKPHG